jgi:hypothetical protein
MTAGWRGYFQWFPDYYIEINDVLEDGEKVALFGFAAKPVFCALLGLEFLRFHKRAQVSRFFSELTPFIDSQFDASQRRGRHFARFARQDFEQLFQSRIVADKQRDIRAVLDLGNDLEQPRGAGFIDSFVVS